MKKILVPTDFSDASVEAYHYAANLAKIWGADILLAHIWHTSYVPAVAHGNINTVIPPADFEATWRENLHQFADRVGHDRAKTRLYAGFAAEKLIELSGSGEFDMLVMGTSGERDALDRLFGSISSEVSQEAHCPVLLVPQGHQYDTGFKNILYGTNFYASNKYSLDEILDFGQHFNANVHFVHVKTKADDESAENIEDMLYQELYNMHHSNVDVVARSVVNEDVKEGLYTYADNHNIDLIVLVARDRSWWEDLLTRDVTEKMTFSPKHPLLVLHIKEKVA